MDIYLNNEGDILKSNSGDIQIVYGENELLQYLRTVLNEDSKYGLTTLYNLALSQYNGGIIDKETIENIQSDIEYAIKSFNIHLNINFYDPIISNDGSLFIMFKVSYEEKFNNKMLVYYSSNKIFVNYVN